MTDEGTPAAEAERMPHFEHGRLTYLQLPAADPMRSATFYEAVFGWRIERPYASFEAPGLIGQWVDDRPPAPDAGPLLWLNVDDIREVLRSVGSHDGEALSEPAPDGPTRLLATIRDPGGNAIGLVQLLPGS